MDDFTLISNNECNQIFRYEGPKACESIEVPLLKFTVPWIKRFLGFWLILLGVSITFFGEKVLMVILRAIVTLIITWQLFEFVYNVILPEASGAGVAVLTLIGSAAIGYVAGE